MSQTRRERSASPAPCVDGAVFMGPSSLGDSVRTTLATARGADDPSAAVRCLGHRLERGGNRSGQQYDA
jgi:hypothetical protein